MSGDLLIVSHDIFHSSSRSSGAVQEYGRYKEIIEDADFEALDWKLRGCKVRIINVLLPIVTTLLFQISKSLRNLFSQI